jgi:putative salt-induced outer membrane protein YdiY
MGVRDWQRTAKYAQIRADQASTDLIANKLPTQFRSVDNGITNHQRGEISMRKVYFAVVVCLLAFTAPATADTIKLKNGDRLTGAIVKSDEKALVIKTDYAGPVTVNWDAIQEVESTQPLNVFSKSGQKLVGTLTTAENKIAVTTTDAGKVELAKSDITTMRNADEQVAWQKEQDRYANPSVLDLWAGSADFGIALTTGNSSTMTTTAGLDLARITRRDKTTVFYRQVSATDRNVSPSRKIANAKRAGVQYDLKLSDRSFVFGFANFDFDEFLRLDLRFAPGGGFGYNVVKGERSTFDVFGGIAYNKEIFDVTPAPTTAVPNPTYTTRTRDSIEGFVGEEWRFKMNGRTQLFEKAVLFPNFSDRGEYRFNFDAGMTTALSKYLSWNLTYSNRFLSNPPLAGIKKNDALLSTGIRFTFAK